MAQSIKRHDVLKELDIKSDPDGKPRTFSIRFCKRDGVTVFIPRAVTSGTGINRNLSINRERGFLSVDEKFRAQGHVYPVNIDNLLEYNNQIIRL